MAWQGPSLEHGGLLLLLGFPTALCLSQLAGLGNAHFSSKVRCGRLGETQRRCLFGGCQRLCRPFRCLLCCLGSPCCGSKRRRLRYGELCLGRTPCRRHTATLGWIPWSCLEWFHCLHVQRLLLLARQWMCLGGVREATLLGALLVKALWRGRYGQLTRLALLNRSRIGTVVA